MSQALLQKLYKKWCMQILPISIREIKIIIIIINLGELCQINALIIIK
jgi:hypothetical protein